MYRVVVEFIPEHQIAQNLTDQLRKVTSGVDGIIVRYEEQEVI